ncbi:hypothetical protein [Alkaliphilus serpentinus]|uniref:Uncharacterized protein n=1 Tax=Alkaliphilus serpentinus TaxID=1482731 RepID=A0A833HSD6_9FIRM|nr:hypothetical protein [Alkaliphilus serpentinus]KAB3533220.1 hypothetical protein F8153_01345 [Alkaliphilus serpentinus]
MANYQKEVLTLLASDVFTQLLTSKNLQIAQLNAAISLLIKSRIPFNLEYSPGTRRLAASAQLKIFITPSINLDFIISIGEGGGVFSTI